MLPEEADSRHPESSARAGGELIYFMRPDAIEACRGGGGNQNQADGSEYGLAYGFSGEPGGEENNSGNEDNKNPGTEIVKQMITAESADSAAQVMCRFIVGINKAAWPVADIEARTTTQDQQQGGDAE